ncbi:hypothetical protein ACRAWD_31710 [Caulobacter segnis]
MDRLPVRPALEPVAGFVQFRGRRRARAFLSPDWAGPELFWPLILIGVGQAFLGVAMLRFATWQVVPPRSRAHRRV